MTHSNKTIQAVEMLLNKNLNSCETLKMRSVEMYSIDELRMSSIRTLTAITVQQMRYLNNVTIIKDYITQTFIEYILKL